MITSKLALILLVVLIAFSRYFYAYFITLSGRIKHVQLIAFDFKLQVLVALDLEKMIDKLEKGCGSYAEVI